MIFSHSFLFFLLSFIIELAITEYSGKAKLGNSLQEKEVEKARKLALQSERGVCES